MICGIRWVVDLCVVEANQQCHCWQSKLATPCGTVVTAVAAAVVERCKKWVWAMTPFNRTRSHAGVVQCASLPRWGCHTMYLHLSAVPFFRDKHASLSSFSCCCVCCLCLSVLQAAKFQRQGTQLRKKMWWQNFRMQIIVVGVVLLLVVVIFLLACFTGGKNCVSKGGSKSPAPAPAPEPEGNNIAAPAGVPAAGMSPGDAMPGQPGYVPPPSSGGTNP